jgi:ribosomal protein S4E
MALRDMLNLARTSKETELMVRSKRIKINGRVVSDIHETIKLFNLFEADKHYKLILLPTGRFAFEPTKAALRFAKVIGKKMLNGKVLQYNLHDGTNFISKDSIAVGDSVELDTENKVKKVHTMEKGKEVFIYEGKSAGHSGIVEHIHGNKLEVKLEKRSVTLDSRHVIVQ